MARNRFRGNRRVGEGPETLGGRVAGVLARVVRRVVKLSVVLALLGAVGYGGWQAVLRSPYFRVRTISVQPTKHLDRDAIVARLGLDDTTNVFRFDPEVAAEALRDHPWVARATVRKALPDRVEIEVVEREPAGVVVLDGLYLVDATGRPFVRPEPREALGLTVVSGLDRATYEADAEHGRERIRSALALARLYGQSPLAARRPLSAVHLDAGGKSELLLGRTRVVLGRDGFKEKLVRLEEIFSKLSSRNMDAEYILLSEDNRRAIVKERSIEREMSGSLSLRSEGMVDEWPGN